MHVEPLGIMPSFNKYDLVELTILRGQEVDELVDGGFLPKIYRFDDEVLDTILFSYPEIKLQITTGEKYPAEQLCFAVEDLVLPRLVFDSLRSDLRKIVSEEAKINNYEAWSNRDKGCIFGFKMTALHIIQKTAEHLGRYRSELTQRDGEEQPIQKLHSARYKNDYIPDVGIDFSAIQPCASAFKILGKTPEEICSNIPQSFRILHVENVIRNDAYNNFLKYEGTIRERLGKVRINELRQSVPFNSLDRRRQDMAAIVDYLVAPKITFHGTSNHLVPSIVRHGFLKPGDLNPQSREMHSVRCGNTYGRGIYSSPSPEFSLMYSGEDARPTKPNGFWGLKLIVCATIMGRSAEIYAKDNWRTQSEPYPGADSHVANKQLEYIVFENSQILPCYIIHLDWREDNRYYFDDIPEDPRQWQKRKPHHKLEPQILAPGDKQRLKQALVAKAAKYFPDGYGPATGTSFVVEEVGEVDKDEEDYGDYQKDRIDGVAETSIWDWDDPPEGFSEKDEYTEALLAKRARVKKTVFNKSSS